jgi:hypothetical protein
MAASDFGSRYGKARPDKYFARGVAKGVAVNSAKPAKASSKLRLQLRTLSVNTCVRVLLAQLSLSSAYQLHFEPHQKTHPPHRLDQKMSFDIDQWADRY